MLSEVGPAASVRDPLAQAVEWLGLVDPAEVPTLEELSFGALVEELADRAATRDQHLVVRDFCTPNFLLGAYGDVLPSGAIELDAALADVGIERAAVVVSRRAAAVYGSIVRSLPHLADLTVDEFGVSYLAFARVVAQWPLVRYEDLVTAPLDELARLCDIIGCRFDPDALTAFASFDACTGDVGLSMRSRGARAEQVVPLADDADDPRYLAAAAHPLCRAADELFGYAPIGEAAPLQVAAAAYESVLATMRRLLVGVDAAHRDALEHLSASVAHAEHLAREVEQLHHVWDQTTGELARAEGIAADRRRQIELLLAALEHQSEQAGQS